MSAQNKVRVNDTAGATNSAPRNSIVDAFVYGPIFPCNYWRTLAELAQLYEKRDLDDKDMLKLKLLAVTLTEQLMGQLSVNSVKVLRLMEEYIKVNRGEKRD